MVKFVHTSDWHIYDRHKYSKDGGRLKELVKNCEEIIEGAANAGCDRLIIAGDIFHHYNPSEILLQTFAKLMSKAIALNVKVRVIIGQHDTNGRIYSLQSLQNYLEATYKKLGLNDMDEYLKIYPSGKVYHEQVKNVNFYYVSWAQNMSELITSIKSNAGNNVLVTHTGMLGAKTPSGYLMSKGYLDPNSLKQFDYVAMGDFHNSQFIEPNIYYSGSPIRFTWGEKDDVLGYNLVEIDKDVSVSQIPLVDIEMIDLKIDAKEITENEIPIEFGSKSVKDAVLKIEVVGKLTDTKRIILRQSLYNAGARQVHIKSQKENIQLEEAGGSVAGLSIIDMIKKQKLNKPLEDYGLEIATQI